ERKLYSEFALMQVRRASESYCCLAAGNGASGAKDNLLCAMPEDVFADGAQVFAPLDDGKEMVAGELAQLAGEVRRAIGEEDLRLAVATGVEEDLARSGVAGGILEADVEAEVAQRDPARLAAPPRVDELLRVGKQRLERRARARRGHFLEPRHQFISGR